MKRNIDPALKAEYLNWLMSPPGQREPASKKAFAEGFDVSLRTLFNWEKEPVFRARLATLRKEWGMAFHGDILERLMLVVNEGKDTDAIAASRLLLAHLDVGVEDAPKVKVDKKAIELALEELGFEVKSS